MPLPSLHRSNIRVSDWYGFVASFVCLFGRSFSLTRTPQNEHRRRHLTETVNQTREHHDQRRQRRRNTNQTEQQRHQHQLRQIDTSHRREHVSSLPAIARVNARERNEQEEEEAKEKRRGWDDVNRQHANSETRRVNDSSRVQLATAVTAAGATCKTSPVCLSKELCSSEREEERAQLCVSRDSIDAWERERNW